jgi:hypothetical protein
MRFGIDIDSLINKESKTEDEEKFLNYYYRKMPVFLNKSTMNRICWSIEKEFDNYKSTIDKSKFDYKILMNDNGYNSKRFTDIKNLYEDYNQKIKQFTITTNRKKIDEDEKKVSRTLFREDFKRKAYEICNDENELCNIVVELCYRNDHSKQFAWDIGGDTIIKNLLIKNNYTVKYPVSDEEGDIEFGGERFSILTKTIESGDNYEIDIE